jgi:Domain of unknown function (DUF4166)
MNQPSIWQRALGSRFDALPHELRYFHALQGRHVLTGAAEVRASESAPARWLARWVGTPRRSGFRTFFFTLHAAADVETWGRDFQDHRMTSSLAVQQDQIIETVGPVRLTFELRADAGGLDMRLVAMRVIGLPWPRCMRPMVMAREQAGPIGNTPQLHFDIRARLPLLGEFIRYRGHLDLPMGAP